MRKRPIAPRKNETLVGLNVCGFLGLSADEHMQSLNATGSLSCAPFFFLF